MISGAKTRLMLKNYGFWYARILIRIFGRKKGFPECFAE